MRKYTLLDTDQKISTILSISPIAVDFEGEFNLHVYGEHLCLIQIFTGTDFYIIDPRAEGVTREGLAAFFQSPAEKVWFDCQSDAALVYKNYGMDICNIFDIRILAKLLGFDGNLSALVERYLGLAPETGKKRKQISNWMKRPVPEAQIEYALSDVEHLLALRAILEKEVREAGLWKAAVHQMKRAAERKIPEPGWKKLPGWKRLSKAEKVYARNIFLARDRIAQRFNVPPARVMDKHLIISLAKNPPGKTQLDSILRAVPPRFYRFASEGVSAAIAKSQRELGSSDKPE